MKNAHSASGDLDFWDSTLNDLAGEGVFTHLELALLRQVKNLGRTADNVVLVVPGQMVKDLIEAKFHDVIIRKLNESLSADNLNLLVMVDESLTSSYDSASPEADSFPVLPSESFTPDVPVSHESVSESKPVNVLKTAANPSNSEIDKTTGLNPKYTFDVFVIGSSNSFTAAAAEAVVVSPAQAYNPLFIYGGSGLGKTHLLHAIGNYALELNPGTKVKYVSSEEFTNEFINAIADGRASAFQARYREVDFLLIDDIQFLQGKEQTVEEFFHTFNTLHTAGKQVVITSDVPPRELKSFEERITSRLEWGLLTDIQPPNLETRIAILRRKATQEGMVIPDEVIQWIASNVFSNIRELEGALIRVSAFSSLNSEPVTLASAQAILRDYVTGKGSQEITPKMIIDFTAKYFHINSEDILSADRSRTVVGPRQVAMYLCRELTELSLPKVGEAFGGRDHTTVMHAVKKIMNSMNEDTAIFKSVTEITNDIRRTLR